jgi:hypothetical protein
MYSPGGGVDAPQQPRPPPDLVEVGLDRHQGQHGNVRRARGAEHEALALGGKRNRRLALVSRGGDQDAVVSGPGRAVGRHGQIQLQRGRPPRVEIDNGVALAGQPGDVAGGTGVR